MPYAINTTTAIIVANSHKNGQLLTRKTRFKVKINHEVARLLLMS